MNRLTEWVINRIKTEYKDDVALLIGITGHATNEDEHGEIFDYFVPSTEHGNELAETFIIDGVGHDLYPRSWERLEDSVNLDDMAILIDNATILYSRAKEDEERFMDLRKRLSANLNDPEFVYNKALEYMDKALEVYQALIFEDEIHRVRSEANLIHEYLSKAVAVLNNTYTESPLYSEKQAFDGSPKSRMYHSPLIKKVPDGFFENAGAILSAKSAEAVRGHICSLLTATRSFILEYGKDIEEKAAEEQKKNVNWENLADWYREISLWFRRIRFFCEKGLTEEAYIQACNLQEELMYVAEEYGILEKHMMDAFDADDLSKLAARSDDVEAYINAVLTEHGCGIVSYASVDEFLAAR